MQLFSAIFAGLLAATALAAPTEVEQRFVHGYQIMDYKQTVSTYTFGIEAHGTEKTPGFAGSCTGSTSTDKYAICSRVGPGANVGKVYSKLETTPGGQILDILYTFSDDQGCFKQTGSHLFNPMVPTKPKNFVIKPGKVQSVPCKSS